MASKQETVFSVLACILIGITTIALVAFVIINLETESAKREVARLGGQARGYEVKENVKSKLIEKKIAMEVQYQGVVNQTNKIIGYKHQYAEQYGQIHGVYPPVDAIYVGDDGLPKPYLRRDENDEEVQDSGFIKKIERLDNVRNKEYSLGEVSIGITKAESRAQVELIKEKDKVINEKIKEIGTLENQLVKIKIDSDKEVKKMRVDLRHMENDLNVKIDKHLKSVSSRTTKFIEMRARLANLKRLNFIIVRHDDLIKLSRKKLEIEARKERLKNIQFLDHEQLAEAVFQARVVDGKITNVSNDGMSLIIDVGSIHGLKPNQKFEIFELKNGVKKIIHGKLIVKEVSKYNSVCAPIISNGKIPLIVVGYNVGDFDFKSFEKLEFVLVGNFKSRYTKDELKALIKQKNGIYEEVITYTTDHLVLGEKPKGDLPGADIAANMKDDFLYKKKTIAAIITKYGYSSSVTRYFVLFEAAKEMGVKILDEIKLINLLHNRDNG
ncbi:MAG: hypothetical protein COA79_03695 [Planctomycetota bacterium]|nr:MAG: hypothetical protein COA79_03695 [Planctomycetota bacterium]